MSLRVCPVCGGPVPLRTSKGNVRLYCSRPCAVRANRARSSEARPFLPTDAYRDLLSPETRDRLTVAALLAAHAERERPERRNLRDSAEPDGGER